VLSLRSARGDPSFDFRAIPSDPTAAELNPLGKLASLFESCDMLRTIRNTVDRLQALLIDKSIV
jgi:hypothetical protein